MKTPAHISFGLFSATIVASAFSPGIDYGMNSLTFGAAGIAVFGSVLPDIDNQHAPISKALLPFSKVLRRRFSHRTLTHSLLGLGIFASAAWSILWLSREQVNLSGIQSRLFLSVFVLSYTSHLVLDTCTKRGIRWLYPLIRNPFGYPTLEQFRPATGDRRAEYAVSVFSLSLVTAFSPVAKTGADVTLANLVGSFEHLLGVYQSAVGTEVLLVFEGYHESDKTPIPGSGIVLFAEDRYFIIRQGGRAVKIGEREGEIRLLKGSMRLLRVPVVERTLTFRNVRVEQIASDIGKGMASGSLNASRSFRTDSLIAPWNLKQSGINLSLVFVTSDQLLALGIKPSGMSEAETDARIEKLNSDLDSLLNRRANNPDLYSRDVLYGQITDVRRKIESLMSESEKRTSRQSELLFSGELSVRSLPELK